MRNNNEIIQKARRVILDSFLKDNELQGFPEIIGRDRSTEWGGTISALHVLHGMNQTQEVTTAIELSLKGLLQSQSSNNAWGAGGVDLIEATSEIVYYLSKDFPTHDGVKESIEKAASFIESKYYESGYYHSGAFSGHSEHTIYATYQAVRALNQLHRLSDEQKIAIKNWIENNKTDDGLWGDNNDSAQSSIAHSIYALLTLLFLDENPKDLKKKYKKQINLVFKSIIKNNTYFYYEEYSIASNESDSSGKKFNRIRINHFVLPLAISLFLKISCFPKTRILIKRLKRIRYDGAWGLYQSFRTTWATQQAIDALTSYQNEKRTFWDLFPSFFLLLYYKYWYTVIILVLVLLILLAVFKYDNVLEWCVSFVIGVITDVLANKITG